MFRYYLLLLTSITALFAQRGPLTLFRLYTAYESESPEPVRSAMRQELESIFDPIGWQIAWRPLDGSSYGEMSANLAVVHFLGTCDATDLTVTAETPTVLGSTDMANGRVMPFSNVDCSAVRALLAPLLTTDDIRARQQAFGRAVGRVLAHELYHVLTKERRHGSKGIGEAHFNAAQLLGSRFRFAPAEVAKLRLNLLPALNSVEEPRLSEMKAACLYVTSGCVGCHGVHGEGTRWGPALADRSAADARALQARLINRYSAMYIEAKRLSVLWPSLEPTDVELLSAYLKTLIK